MQIDVSMKGLLHFAVGLLQLIAQVTVAVVTIPFMLIGLIDAMARDAMNLGHIAYRNFFKWWE